MTLATNPALAAQVAATAATAGLHVVSAAPATSFSGAPTTKFQLQLTATPSQTTQLELSNSFDLTRADFTTELAAFLAETAQRLRTPRPDTLLTLGGIPLSFASFEWPFHASTAGADTNIVHGMVRLEDVAAADRDPATPALSAKIAASITVTFNEIVKAPEQPFAESFILNAVRKTFDQGQLELVKSGNRQPVPVTTRYYSPRSGKFVFNDTTEPQRKQFLAAKTFWLSGVLGGQQPVWLLDPRDAQYLNTTVADLKLSVEALAKEGLIVAAPAPDRDPAYAIPTPALMGQAAHFRAHLAEALAFIKPSFNEEMRAGHTNM